MMESKPATKRRYALHLFFGQTKLKRKQKILNKIQYLLLFLFFEVFFFKSYAKLWGSYGWYLIRFQTIRFLLKRKKDCNDMLNATFMWFLLLFSKLWKSFPAFKCQRENLHFGYRFTFVIISRFGFLLQSRFKTY